jgi:hypothetical protein
MFNFRPDTGHRRSKRPRFAYQATVDVYTRTGPDARPAATLLVNGWAWSRSQAHTDTTHSVRGQLATLQVPLEVIEAAHFEPVNTDWWALDPKHVRNPEGDPVEAVVFAELDERATLIRQQRLVPDDWDDSNAWYVAPKAQPQPKHAEAA